MGDSGSGMKPRAAREPSRGAFRRRLIACFAAAFAVFAVMLVVFQVRLDTQTKTQFVLNDLDSYAEILSKTEDYGGVTALFPSDLRATVLDTLGNVLFDSVDSLGGVNHSDRPEVSASMLGNAATSIRKSETTGVKYLYYSKTYGDRTIRVALPYDDDVKPRVRPNSIFLLASALLFALSLLTIILLSSRFGYDIQKFQTQYKDDSDREVATIKQQMTSNISHELRTPVTGIMGCLETLEACPEMDAERRKGFIHRAYLQSVRLSDLIRDVALISRIEESPEKLVKQIVSLGEIVDDAVSEFAARIDENGVRVENMLSADLRICGNRTLLHALFRNLLENTLKYAGRGVTVRIERCPSGNDGDSVCLTYYDTGGGVPPEHLPRLFERFYRVSEGRTRDGGGSGLGLSIVRNAVAFHGGEIRVLNRQPRGLQFFFTLRK